MRIYVSDAWEFRPQVVLSIFFSMEMFLYFYGLENCLHIIFIMHNECSSKTFWLEFFFYGCMLNSYVLHVQVQQCFENLKKRKHTGGFTEQGKTLKVRLIYTPFIPKGVSHSFDLSQTRSTVVQEYCNFCISLFYPLLYEFLLGHYDGDRDRIEMEVR